MVTAFGLDDFTVVRVLVLLDLALTARCLFGSIRSGSAAARLGIQNVDNVAQAVASVALSPL